MDNPGVEQYRQLRTANKTFNQRVWRHSSAREFMIATGWVLVRIVTPIIMFAMPYSTLLGGRLTYTAY